ncbi:uncharacterized protein [Paramormyrops kingsleyae]|uniref:uncharacterized protein isoform X2 n=1 Tax=Paramormyrops kingsleyae TaxID=1676925 RepID=UPI003B97C512
MNRKLQISRNHEFLEISLEHDGETLLQFAAVYGFRNIQTLVHRMRKGRVPYQLVEVLSCPGVWVSLQPISPSERHWQSAVTKLNTEAAPKKMVSHPCLFVFAVFGLRSTIAGEVKCNISVDSRNAVLDCHLPCKGLITFLNWNKSQSSLALYDGTNYTHINRFGFRQPWNPSSQDISLQINNPTKEDSGEYKYSVLSTCEALERSVHLNIPDLTTPSPIQHNGEKHTENLKQ